MRSDRDQWDEWLDVLDGDEKDLSTWELDFTESLRTQLQAGHDLSDRQADKLEEVYDRHVRR